MSGSSRMKSATNNWLSSRILKFFLSATVAVSLLLLVAPYFTGPPCPRTVTIATGSPDGAYAAFAEKYRKVLARNGVALEIRHTAGSVENASLLADDSSGVTVAFLQGGVRSELPADFPVEALQSLGSLYREPLWVFHQKDHKVTRLSDLKGKCIAVGAEGSGTRAMAEVVLADNGVREDDAGTRLLSLSSQESADALQAGTVDAAFFVISPSAAVIKELIHADGLELFSLSRSDAYQRRHRFLSTVVVPRGLLDLQKDLPPADVELVAPTANLVTRADLHPTLIPLLLQAAEEVHRTGGLLERMGEFPSPNFVDFPLNANARSYLDSGPSFLYRWLPFRYAAWLDRMKLMLLPMCTLLIPLLKTAPPLIRWRIRSKIYKWYRDLREIDQKLRDENHTDLSAERERLRVVEAELAEVNVPLSYMMEFYHLRLHVAFVREQLQEQTSEHTPSLGDTRRVDAPAEAIPAPRYRSPSRKPA